LENSVKLKRHSEIESKKKNDIMAATSQKIMFYSAKDEWGCFSNFSQHAVEWQGELYPTSEHAFQAAKFPSDAQHQKAIREARTAAKSKQLGGSRAHSLRRDWEKAKDGIMEAILICKFEQHQDLRDVLLSTGDRKLVEHTKRDRYWGDGGDGNGRNQLGKCLMNVRSHFRNK
jgi:N-glycosidase YbiA